MRANVPAKKGLVFSLWTFHYEEHYKTIENPDGTPDDQYVPGATGDVTVVNHEIGTISLNLSLSLSLSKIQTRYKTRLGDSSIMSKHVST